MSGHGLFLSGQYLTMFSHMSRRSLATNAVLCGGTLPLSLCPAKLLREAGNSEQPGDTTTRGHRNPARIFASWRENISLKIRKRL